MGSHRFFPYLVLLCGVIIVSGASIITRVIQNDGVPSLTIAAGRLVFASLILTPIAWSRAGAELRQIGQRELGLALLSGAFLAAHFASWISSLAYTSVASSAALVATNPLWVGLATLFVLRERLSRVSMLGIGLTVVGSVLIALSDSGATGKAPLLGDTLALVGAFAGSGYFLIGQVLRRRVLLLTYIWLVYTSAAVLLVIATLATGQRVFGFPPLAYVAVLALAVGPQLLGHTSFNWALKYLSASFIAVAILGEPIGSALLAFVIFKETFQPLQLLGFTVLLVGIGAAAFGERATPAVQPVAPETATV